MTLENWIRWAFEPWPNSRHPFHSYALCRQAARDMGVPVDHEEFLVAMEKAGYHPKCWYGSAAYFDCLDSPSKRQYQRKRFIGCDDRVKHPLVA